MTDTAPSELSVSLFALLREEFRGQIEPLRCTKATLVHLSHTLEDLVLTQKIPALLFTGFQESSHWRKETERYRALAEIAQQVCIFAGGKLPPESSARELHVTLRGDDPLRQEWFLALLCPEFAVLLCGQDRQVGTDEEALRQFDTLWSFEPPVLERVFDLLERVIADYRPERLAQLQAARAQYPLVAPSARLVTKFTSEMIRFEEGLHGALHRLTTTLNEQLRWRDDLTATLVHDMRSPLTGIIGSIKLLEQQDKYDPEILNDMLGLARRSASNLQDLIQLVLDTNRLSAGQLAMTWEPMAPGELIHEAVLPLQQLLAGNQQSLTVALDERVRVLWGDRQLITRIIQNLVTNAAKFSPLGGEIIVGLALTPDGKQIELRVRDNGVGIASDTLPHIFDRYYQVRPGDRRGVGLGLYFCRLAAEAHGGSIRAASQAGMGATITLVLPMNPPRR